MTTRITCPLLAFVVVLALLASLSPGQRPVSADGVGIYPTNLSFENGARGGEYFRTVGVINSGDSDVVFTLEGEGAIADWISFVEADDRGSTIDSVMVPANSERQTLLRVSVPDDAANGEYRGSARVVARATGGVQAGAASVGVGAAIDVRIDVTGEQRLEGSLVDSSVGNVEEGLPLRARAVIRNSGNVRFIPQVTLEVLDIEGNVVARETFSQDTAAFPDESVQLDHELDVSGRGLVEGEYVARIAARTGELDLGSLESSFSILPEGTLTRRGELRNITLAIAPRPGDAGKLAVAFANTGQIDTLAKFVGELYLQQRLVDALTSEELLVPVGEQRTLELLFHVDDPGEYLIKGKVNYQGKETETRELAFTVTEEEPLEPVSQGAALEASDPEPTAAPEPAESEASGAGGAPPDSAQSDAPPSDQPGAPASFWQKISRSVQESSFNSPLGISVIVLGLLVVLLLVLVIGRRGARR